MKKIADDIIRRINNGTQAHLPRREMIANSDCLSAFYRRQGCAPQFLRPINRFYQQSLFFNIYYDKMVKFFNEFFLNLRTEKRTCKYGGY